MSDDWNSGIVFAELTDVGMRRANNQDSLACLPATTQQRFWDHGHLFVVADGMGAHAAGELASRMATERIAMQFFRAATTDSGEALRMAVDEANNEIHRRGQNNPEFHNMGTTASALAISPGGAVVAHVGDSRVYRLRKGDFEQLTFDHSLVWEVEASGQASSGYPKNVITRSLGPNANVDVDVEGPFPIEKGDCFLLCSDGLSGLVEDAEIGTLVDCLPEEKAVRVLVDLANLRGGSDNSSVIVVRVVQWSRGAAPKRAAKRGHPATPVAPAIVVTAGICFVGAVLLAVLKMWGPMVIALLLGLIAAIISLIQFAQGRTKAPRRVKRSGSKGPYRRYDATPTSALYQRLGETVRDLKNAADHNHWMMEWDKVNEFQRQGSEALKRKDAKSAIRYQAEAIIETMKQLREQNNRAASGTVIDH